MKRNIRGWWVGAIALLIASAAQATAPGENANLAASADGILVGLPLVAFGLTFLLQNPSEEAAAAKFDGKAGGFDFLHMTNSPRHNLGLALLRTEVVSFGLKGLVNEDRPNGEPHSFPSAHTSTTFAGAEFIRKEYGWGWGAPAYLAAGFTGWTRVKNYEHYWHDVVAGAAIGILSNHDLGEIGPFRIQPSMLGFRKGATPIGDQPDETGVAPGLSLEMHF